MKKHDYSVTTASRLLNDDGTTVDSSNSTFICDSLERAFDHIRKEFNQYVGHFTIDKITIKKIPHEEMPF